MSLKREGIQTMQSSRSLNFPKPAVLRSAVILFLVASLLLPSAAVSEEEPTVADSPPIVAQQDDSSERRESRPLEPRYQPREPEEKSWYNDGYIFGMTRGLAGSTIAPAGKAPLFLFTVPLDIILLPFTIIGGLFG